MAVTAALVAVVLFLWVNFAHGVSKAGGGVNHTGAGHCTLLCLDVPHAFPILVTNARVGRSEGAFLGAVVCRSRRIPVTHRVSIACFVCLQVFAITNTLVRLRNPFTQGTTRNAGL